MSDGITLRSPCRDDRAINKEYDELKVKFKHKEAGGDRFVSDACGDAGCAFDTSTRVCEINSSTEGEGIVCPNVVNSPPLSGLFSGTGIVIILLMVGLILLAIRLTLPSRK